MGREGVVIALSAQHRKLFDLAVDTVVLALVGLVALGISYVLGNGMLWRDLVGNDSPLHIGYASWLNSYFPRIPHWYPLQGGGISLLHGYPVLPHLLLVVLHRLTSLSLLQAYRAVSFLSLPVAALGIYGLSRVVLRSRTAGIIASFFFLLSPITWTWIYNWGFFAQQVSFVFVPLALLAFDRCWHATLGPKKDGARRLWFAACCSLVVVSTLCHLLVGFASVAAMFLYLFFSMILSTGSQRKARFTSGVKILVLLGVAVGLVAAAYLVPFFNYGQIANREGVNTPSADQLHRLSLSHFFGLSPIDDREVLTRMQFPLIVSLGAGLGLIGAFVEYRKNPENTRAPLALGLTAVFASTFALVPALPGLVLKISSLLIHFINFRSMLVIAMMLLPVMAGYGVSTLARFILFPERVWAVGDPKPEAKRRLLDPLRTGIAAALAILSAGAGSFLVGDFVSPGQSHLPYGPLSNGIDLSDIWERGPDFATRDLGEQLAPRNWRVFELSDTDRLTTTSMEMAALINAPDPVRIDVSPYEGRLAMDLVTFTDASQINCYTFTASLIHGMWGYQQNVYYSHETPVSEYGNPVSLQNAAAWFGTEFVYLDPTNDDAQMYEQAGWDLYFDGGSVQLWHNPTELAMAEVADRPAILVISKLESDGYMNLFRLANDGMLPYDEAFLVEGEPNVDSYTAEVLNQFDAVFLYGYDYRNSRRAWETLAEYVSQGGSLFVDTGWEFRVPEWEFTTAPEVLPLERLSWTDYGANPSYELGPEAIVGSISSSALKPLTWEGIPWMLSGGNASDVRDWGIPVLSANGNPLVVAGQFGSGRVVWSGMNLIAHAQYQGKNAEEINLLHNLISWLIGRGQPVQLGTAQVNREYPDKIELAVTGIQPRGSWLYWREAFYPRWQATAVDAAGEREVPIYRAGPGFMLVRLDPGDGSAFISLNWESSGMEKLAFVGSAVGLLLLAAHVVDGLLLGGNGLTWLKIAIVTRIPKPFLGEGSNKEWAERKRRELTEGELAPGPRIYQPNEAIPWMRLEVEIAPEPSGPANSNGQVPEAPETIEEHEKLLESWLAETGHSEDAWAERLLSKRPTSKES